MTGGDALQSCSASPMEPDVQERFLRLARSARSDRVLDVATGRGALAL